MIIDKILVKKVSHKGYCASHMLIYTYSSQKSLPYDSFSKNLFATAILEGSHILEFGTHIKYDEVDSNDEGMRIYLGKRK